MLRRGVPRVGNVCRSRQDGRVRVAQQGAEEVSVRVGCRGGPVEADRVVGVPVVSVPRNITSKGLGCSCACTRERRRGLPDGVVVWVGDRDCRLGDGGRYEREEPGGVHCGLGRWAERM